MPEQIRLKVGGISNAQFSVYDEFARNIPGFQPMSERDAALLMQKVPLPVRISIIFLRQNRKISNFFFTSDPRKCYAASHPAI